MTVLSGKRLQLIQKQKDFSVARKYLILSIARPFNKALDCVYLGDFL